MEKSGKCYYVIIKNKKRGKFSGAGPIQVAKKVASKKLKAGKDMEFYLDEVGAKNKRYGPYQARKDKKSDKVVVVKGKKVMKGGLLSIRDRQILTIAFNNNNKIEQTEFIKQVAVDIKYSKYLFFIVDSVLIFFKTNDQQKEIYTHAIFVEQNGIYIWILQLELNGTVSFINFFDFFLNPDYFRFSNEEKEYILRNLITNTELPIIRQPENNIIKSFLSEIRLVLIEKINTAKYFPDYSRPLIRKCVYPDLTFGILDEETPVRILQNKSDFPKPESSYQKYLIYKNTGISGMSFNEPIIYVRDANISKNQHGGTLTAQQIQAKINRLKTDLNSLKTHQSYIKKLVNNQKVLKSQQNVGYKLPNNVLNKQKQNRKLLIELNSEITEIENEIQTIQTLQQQQLQTQINQPEQVKVRRSIGANNNSLQEFRRELQQQQQQLQQQQLQQQLQQQQLHFDYCIFSSGNKLKIMSYNLNNTLDFSLDSNNYIYMPDEKIFKNLIDIPPEFGEFRRIRQIAHFLLNRMSQKKNNYSFFNIGNNRIPSEQRFFNKKPKFLASNL